METGLTPTQKQVLAFIRRSLQQHGNAPTLREIAEGLALPGHSSAQSAVEALVRRGLLERLPRHRGLRLPPGQGMAGRLPLIGRVAAGTPLLAVENVESEHNLDPGLFRPRADYLLRVVGLSMRDAGILDGDLIAVHRTATARHGQIVVARLDDEVTVKRLERKGQGLRLLPANPDFAPIEVARGQDFAIEGLYVGLVRTTPEGTA